MNELLGVNVGVSQNLSRVAKIGGKRFVRVDMGDADHLKFVPIGGRLMNSFGVGGKMFEGDLIEFDAEKGTLKLLKTFEVAKAVTVSDTVLYISQGEGADYGYRHLPEAGNILMKAPTGLTGKGTAAAMGVFTPTEITEGGKKIKVWKADITAGALGALSKGDILVEAAEAGASKGMYVTNPNTFNPIECVFTNPVMKGEDPFTGAIVTFAPIAEGLYYKKRMCPLPACVSTLNRSRIAAYFSL